MENTIKILGIAGSLRRGSYNRAALNAAVSLAPAGSKVEAAEIGNLPLYNFDLEQNLPAPVIELKNQIRRADAILFVTPEYNFSLPGVLKNAIDWASRPYTDNVWRDKPVAVMGASTGIMGSVRAQSHLRDIFVYLNMHPVNLPQVLIGNAAEKFDTQGNLTDEHSRQKISELLTALINWTNRLNK